MKVIEKKSNTVVVKPAIALKSHTIQFTVKKFWLPLIFGVSLIYIGHPPYAKERQGTESQGAGRGTKPSTGYTEDKRNRGSNTMEQGKEKIEQGTDRPGSDSRGRATTPSSEKGIGPDTEEMNRNPTPGSENINRDTTGPGGDNMMRDAVPGGSGIKRE